MSLLTSLIPSLSRTTAATEADPSRATTPTVRPVHEIIEHPDAFGLTVHLPGVARDNLAITAEDNSVVIRAERSWKRPAGWTALYRESADLPYELVLQHDNAIDADKIHAELRDGILRLSLPKTEARKPRKVAVNC